MPRTPDIQAVSIVLVGSFNPAIFHPQWFLRQSLIRAAEAESAELRVTHPSVAAFSIGWVQVEVTATRAVFSSLDAAHFDPVRDLVSGTFTILGHTPLSALGLNAEYHVALESESKWHEFGHTLLPKGPWAQLVDRPGTLVAAVQGTRSGSRSKSVNIEVKPSSRIPNGVFFTINEHHDVSDTAEMLSRLTDEWSSSRVFADRVPDVLLNYRLGKQVDG